ncbi:MAG: heme lyase CcmF/NrfE family subunit [Thermaurantiacus tibetensis]
MAAEIGQFALILALVMAVVQAGLAGAGARWRDPALVAAGRAAAMVQGALVLLAFLVLLLLFVRLDLSVELVARHGHSAQPAVYRLAAAWGNHEGSMLLWILMLSGFGAMVAIGGRELRPAFHARVVAVLGLLSAAFLAFLLFTSGPFARRWPPAPEGAELNPLLQDPGLALHPPLLYVGYVGLSVAFAFAAAALLEGRVDSAWARAVRPWILAAWSALTAGIALGSFWAYYELGWGGWWFWDPVENAALLPWLVATALLHSALVLETRGTLVSWTLLLAISAFAMSMVGTFLVRSGILTSVHAFATDPTRGSIILLIIGGFTGAALALFAWRAPALERGSAFAPVSKESGLVANNLFLMAAGVAVLLGTFWPLVIDLATGDRISVGPPYYALTFVPLVVPLLALVSLGPVTRWKTDRLRDVMARLRPAAGAALLAAAATFALFWSAGWTAALAALGFALAAWLVGGAVLALLRRFRVPGGGFALRLVRTTPASAWGMALAHAGLGMLTAGITAASLFTVSEVAAMAPGQAVDLAGRRLTLESVGRVTGPNWEALEARFRLGDGPGGRTVVAQRRRYPASGQQTTEAGIAFGLLGNVYVSVGDATGGRLAVHAWWHPLVGWIWAGALAMALGGAVAMADRRFRLPAAVRAAPAAVPVPAE